MTHDPRFADEDFEDEPTEVEVASDPAIIVEVRLSREELRELSDEERATGMRITTMLRDFALETVRARRFERRAGEAEVAD